MTGPAAATSRGTETPPSLRGAIGTLPYRLQMAGGWIDQPFVSSLNPEPPGSMVVVSLQPVVRYMDRCGASKSSFSFSRNEIPLAIHVLQQAFEMMLEKTEEQDRPESGAEKLII